jgi:hypothetical protein
MGGFGSSVKKGWVVVVYGGRSQIYGWWFDRRQRAQMLLGDAKIAYPKDDGKGPNKMRVMSMPLEEFLYIHPYGIFEINRRAYKLSGKVEPYNGKLVERGTQ